MIRSISEEIASPRRYEPVILKETENSALSRRSTYKLDPPFRAHLESTHDTHRSPLGVSSPPSPRDASLQAAPPHQHLWLFIDSAPPTFCALDTIRPYCLPSAFRRSSKVLAPCSALSHQASKVIPLALGQLTTPLRRLCRTHVHG